MSDIIQDAKDALEHSSPRPWKMDLSSPNMNGQSFCIRTDGTAGTFLSGFATRHIADLPLIEAAPELAKALAEETWEYSYHVQNTIGMWEHPTSHPGDPEQWWETKEEAEEVAIEAHASGYPIRIIRRRVSPLEVISE